MSNENLNLSLVKKEDHPAYEDPSLKIVRWEQYGPSLGASISSSSRGYVVGFMGTWYVYGFHEFKAAETMFNLCNDWNREVYYEE